MFAAAETSTKTRASNATDPEEDSDNPPYPEWHSNEAAWRGDNGKDKLMYPAKGATALVFDVTFLAGRFS